LLVAVIITLQAVATPLQEVVVQALPLIKQVQTLVRVVMEAQEQAILFQEH
jgi:hypothetical protein